MNIADVDSRQRGEPWLRRCLELAAIAASRGDVPVGAVVVNPAGICLGEGFNSREAHHDPCGHAELTAIRSAAATLQSWRLTDCTIYVSLEPCVMCASAIAQARLARLVYGARDPKAGGIVSLYSVLDDPRLNWRVPHQGGLLAAESAALLADFFAARRPNRG